MKALSIKQPWAWLIVMGHKNIENRDWPTDYRGRVYVHAGLKMDYEAFEGDPAYRTLDRFIRDLITPSDNYDWDVAPHAELLGAIVGEVDIVDCVRYHKSPWFFGRYGFVLANPVAYERAIPYKGRLGLFDVTLPSGVTP
jgi:hypothetical protein